MTYAYRKLEPGTPALPPRRVLRCSVLDETMLLVLGKLWYVEPTA